MKSMNTTSLFVELVIIGIGSMLAILLLSLGLFDFQTVTLPANVTALVVLPFLSVAYVLGIVMDRLADKIFRRWDRTLRKQFFSNSDEYHFERTYVYTHASNRINEAFDYGRSRLRIVRAWVINSALIILGSLSFAFNKSVVNDLFPRIILVAFSCTFWGLLCFGSIFAWRALLKADYARLSETYVFLHKSRNQGLAQ